VTVTVGMFVVWLLGSMLVGVLIDWRSRRRR
jgi:hypothetical protein